MPWIMFILGNVPLKHHLLNEETLFMPWWRFVIQKWVNEFALRIIINQNGSNVWFLFNVLFCILWHDRYLINRMSCSPLFLSKGLKSTSHIEQMPWSFQSLSNWKIGQQFVPISSFCCKAIDSHQSLLLVTYSLKTMMHSEFAS